MRPGSLRQRVQLQLNAGTTSDAGDPVERWRTYATRYASITPLSGRELFHAQQVKADVTHQIVMRWQAGTQPTAQHRVVWGKRLFHIVSAINVNERNREIRLTCIEVLPSPICT